MGSLCAGRGHAQKQNIAYNAKGQRLLIAFGNNVMSRYAYDPLSFRLLRQRSEAYSKTTVGNTITYAYTASTLRQDDGFNFDLVGNIVKILDRMKDCGIGGTPDALDREFEYDPLYRLTFADGRESNSHNVNAYLYTDAPVPSGLTDVRTYSRTYSYDKLGNVQKVIQAGTNGFTRDFRYNANVNTLEKVVDGSATLIENFTYDANGNQFTAGTTRNYKWNHSDQLICYYNQAGGGNPSVFTQYDYAGQDRVSKLVKTGTIFERTIYIDGIFEYVKLFNRGVFEKNYIHIMDDKSRIAEVRVNGATLFPGDLVEDVTYLLENQIGSSVMRLKSTGLEIDREEYYPFGDSSLRTFIYKRYRYIGKERDNESGLYYCGARYYVPWLCRFISCDPKASEFPNQSPYNYSFNNPINLKDPSGMAPEGGGDDKPKVDNIGFPANPKDGQQFVHLNKEQNTNWGYVYDAQSKSWLGTGAAANLTEVEVTATATPRAVFTYGSGSNIERTQPHVAFAVQSISYGGGFGVGAEGSFKEFFVGTNIHTKDFLYNKGEQFGVWEVDLKGGTIGHGASIKAGFGELLNPDPWKPISQQIMDIDDYDIEATVGYVTASSTSEVTLGQSRLNYNMVGVAYGFKAKFESPIPLEVSSGFNGLVYTSLQPATREDSARTAKAFPNHPISRAFNAKQSAMIYTKTKILD